MIDKLLSLIPFFSKDYDLGEIEKKKYYVISLILLIEILLLCSDLWFGIGKQLKNILGIKSSIFIVNIFEIVFLCLISLAIISIGIMIISLVLYCIFIKISEINNWNGNKAARVEHLHKVSYGSQFRFTETVEWLIIIFIPLYKWDLQFIVGIFSQIDNLIKAVLGIIAGIVVVTSSIWGIINRFFCLNSYEKSESKKESNKDIELEELLKKSLVENEKLICEMQELRKLWK